MASRLYICGLVVASVAHAQYAPLNLDNTAILGVPGHADVSPTGWGDSYSVGNSCYCETTYDHDIDRIVVSTPLGNKTIHQVCTLLGPGPGSSGRPRYNDIQCGNGPANNAGDETTCPGRIEYGQEGCKYIGPKWNWSFLPTKAPIKPPTRVPGTLAPVQSPKPNFLCRFRPTNAPIKSPTRAPDQISNPNFLYRFLRRFLARLFRC